VAIGANAVVVQVKFHQVLVGAQHLGKVHHTLPADAILGQVQMPEAYIPANALSDLRNLMQLWHS
jgi:hypothetical protein